MPLHPEFEALAQQIAAAAEGQPADPPVEARRLGFNAGLPLAPEIEVGSVEDTRVNVAGGSIGVRIYQPGGSGPHPVVVYFHGGGWVLGDLDSHDAQTRDLCSGVQCVVVAVDYRLAPEHPFPTAAEDCYTALCWAAENVDSFQGDRDRIAVVGDSAGGNLATVVALLAKERAGPELIAQVLIYPVTDADFENESYTVNADGPVLTRDTMRWFWDCYCPDPDQRLDPRAAPMRAEDLSGLPPALILTGEYDPLRDEGEAYGRRLEQAGVPTEIVRFDGFPHFFIAFSRMAPAGAAGMAKVCDTLRRSFGAFET